MKKIKLTLRRSIPEELRIKISDGFIISFLLILVKHFIK